MRMKLIDRRHLEEYESEEEYNKTIPDHQSILDRLANADWLYTARSCFPYICALLRFLKYGEYLDSYEVEFTRWMDAKRLEYDPDCIQYVTDEDKRKNKYECMKNFEMMAYNWTIALRFICWCCIILCFLMLGAIGLLMVLLSRLPL